MIRNTSHENNLFEQILRMKSLMKESKGYGDLIMEGPITGVFSSVVKSLDNLVKVGKITDTVIADAARAVGKMADEATAVMKFQTFYKKVMASGDGSIINELAEATLKTMPPDSAKNVEDLKKSFADRAVTEGGVNQKMIDDITSTIEANVKLPKGLEDLQNVLQAKLLSSFKKTANDALAGGAAVAGKTSNILDTTFDDVVKNANEVLSKEKPPKKITREILEAAEKNVNEIESAFKNGEITQQELFNFLKEQAVLIKSNFTKITEILPKISGLLSSIMEALGSGFKSFMKLMGTVFTWKNLTIFLMAGAFAYVGFAAYNQDINFTNWYGKGKSEQCFGDDTVQECVNSIPGFNTLNASQIDLLCNLQQIPQNEGVGRLGCDNINELAKPEVKVKSITFKAADGVGKVDKFEMTFGDGKTKTYDAKTGKEIGGGGVVPPVPVVPPPGTCTWTTEAAAKAALKGTFSSATDTDIRVDLSACLVYYKPAGFTSEQSYAPGDL